MLGSQTSLCVPTSLALELVNRTNPPLSYKDVAPILCGNGDPYLNLPCCLCCLHCWPFQFFIFHAVPVYSYYYEKQAIEYPIPGCPYFVVVNSEQASPAVCRHLKPQVNPLVQEHITPFPCFHSCT